MSEQSEPPGETKTGGLLVCWSEWMKRLNAQKEKPLCFRWVSASVSSRPASTPPSIQLPSHSDRARHCGKVWYKSSGPSGDAWPQIRAAHCLNASISNSKDQGWQVTAWKEITVCKCVWGKLPTTRSLTADEFVSCLLISFSPTHTCTHRHRLNLTWDMMYDQHANSTNSVV